MQNPEIKQPHRPSYVIFFIFILCLICALALGVTAYSLADAQQNAKEFDQSKQMLIAAKILSHTGQFELLEEDGNISKARFEDGILVKDANAPKATDDQIKKIAALRIRPLLTDKEGNVFTLEDKNLKLADYLAENKKKGYADLPLKLFYAILPNEKEAENITGAEIQKDLSKASTFVLPVSGFGLWAPIYGYVAIGSDGDKVIGTTWYEHGETPGLGANITEAWWQEQFYGKLVFQETAGNKNNFQTANMGIIVVKGKVRDVYGNLPKSKSAVDGMSGATATGDGVTAAYRASLTPYRQFLIKVSKDK